jgi:hypothetical protein
MKSLAVAGAVIVVFVLLKDDAEGIIESGDGGDFVLAEIGSGCRG